MITDDETARRGPRPPQRADAAAADPPDPRRHGADGRAAEADRAALPAQRRRGAAGARPRGPERMTLKELSVFYGDKPAVKRVSLPIRQGEVLALIGPSGCGKTTLLRTLNRLTELTPDARRDGRDHARPLGHRRDRGDDAAAPGLDGLPAAEPVPDVDLRQRRLRAARAGTQAPEPQGARSRTSSRRCGAPASTTRSAADLDHPALRLSGGQQQRLCIARALAAGPEVLLMDEPCSALDPKSTAVIEDLILELRESLAIVIVTHNLQQAHRVGDHVAFMYLGDLVEYGAAEQVFGAPRSPSARASTSGAHSADAARGPDRARAGARARRGDAVRVRDDAGDERAALQERKKLLNVEGREDHEA